MKDICPHCHGDTWAEPHHIDMGHYMYEPARCEECHAHEMYGDVDYELLHDIEIATGFQLGDMLPEHSMFEMTPAAQERVNAARAAQSRVSERDRFRKRYIDEALF